MYQTTYHRPTDLAEALALFSSLEDPAYLSGGHTLIPAMKGRLAAPPTSSTCGSYPNSPVSWWSVIAW